MTELTVAQRDKLMADLRQVIADAEELLKLTAGEMGEKAGSVRDRLQQRMADAKLRLQALQATAADKARAAGEAADDYVHDNPWQSLAIGAGVGLVVGLLMSRR
ncbi:MAG: DUF883 family protein [Proteobacteria bacterium]|nr:DUF883 family protein [Pseudomonadota bacterium]